MASSSSYTWEVFEHNLDTGVETFSMEDGRICASLVPLPLCLNTTYEAALAKYNAELEDWIRREVTCG